MVPLIHVTSAIFIAPFSIQTIRRTVSVFRYSPVLFLLGTEKRLCHTDYQDISRVGRNSIACVFFAIYQQGLRLYLYTFCISFGRFRRLYPHCWCSMNTNLYRADGRRFYSLLPVLSSLTPFCICHNYTPHLFRLLGTPCMDILRRAFLITYTDNNRRFLLPIRR